MAAGKGTQKEGLCGNDTDRLQILFLQDRAVYSAIPAFHIKMSSETYMSAYEDIILQEL